MLKRFTANDNFFGRYERLIKDVVIPYQEKALKDEIPDAAKSHCIENFKMAAEVLKNGKCDGEFYGMVFQDSDVAKWLEGAAYSLVLFPDDELEKRCDEIIDIIGSAQHEDGYLNTFFTVKEPKKRWTNLAEAHELYCAGHLIEAAVAYSECTGKTKFLEIMCRYADHIYNHFIVEKAEGFSGHPEIELALMRLYRQTKNEKYKELAVHFINVRGVDSDYFIKEKEKCGWTVFGNNPWDKEYTQSQAPVREQTQAVGHAVRAVYLYTAMADVANETNDESLKAACKTLWKNITQARMYITGAIGSAYEGEAFTKDYHLPNDTAYAETCAAIGLIFFARKMLQLEKKSEYADVIEKALYNCVLAGMELDGTKFFYVNPLEIIPGISGEARSHPHTPTVRPKWFACACCPPNVARLLPSIAEYAWEISNDVLYSHLYVGGILDVSDVFGGKLEVSTAYPYDGVINYKFVPDNNDMKLKLAIRLPNWSISQAIELNGKDIPYEVKEGYAFIEGNFNADDCLTVKLDMAVRKVFSSTKVSDNNGKVAFTRGPLVYCAEGVDNNGDILSIKVKKKDNAKPLDFNFDKLMGISEITVDAVRMTDSNNLYSFNRPEAEDIQLKLIPYYAWGNRGVNQMRVWLPEE